VARNNELNIIINGDPKGANKALESVGKTAANLEKGLGQIAKAGAIAFAGLTAGITGTLVAFRKQEVAENQLNAVLRSTGMIAGVTAQEVKDLAASLQGVSTFGDEAIIASSNLLLTFKQIGEDVFPRAQASILDVAAAMGVGLKEASISVGKALNDPIEGITALRRVGITFTQSQEDQIRALTELGNVAGAQAIILTELESQFKGSAAAAAGGLGSLIQLKNVFGDLLEVVGAQFVPVIESAAIILKNFFTTLKENEEFVVATARALALGAGIAGLITVTATLGLAFLKVTQVIRALTLSTVILKLVAFGELALVLGGLIGIVAIIISNFERFRPAIDAIRQGFSNLGFTVTDFESLILQLIPVFQGVFAGIVELLVQFATRVALIFEGITKIIQGFRERSLTLIAEGFSQAVVESVKIIPVGLFKAGQAGADAFTMGLQSRPETFSQLGEQTNNFIGKELNKFGDFAEQRLGIDTNLFANLGGLFGIFTGDKEAKTEGHLGNLGDLAGDFAGVRTDIEQQLANDLIDIDQNLGNEQVNVFNQTTDQLISAAQQRASKISGAAEGGGGGAAARAPTGGGGAGGRGARPLGDQPRPTGGGSLLGALLEDSEAGRRARKRLNPTTFNPLTGRNDLKKFVGDVLRKEGVQFQRGFSGEGFSAQFSGKEIVIPENFAQGIRRGRFALTGPGGGGGMGGPVDVNIRFRGNASRFFTAEQNKSRAIGTSREIS
jgi:hypothetical protein